ncbi:MAG: branched-chain amino acid ABC transporter permease [Acidimicrobiia bacterium]|nr:branched-chain amino acid ABC transporter permease [Acidimicrobiia bacterium]
MPDDTGNAGGGGDARPRRPDRHVRDGIVLGTTVGLFGTAFGVLATTSGLSVAQAAALSLLVFTGASQFALVSVVASGGSLVAAFGSALLLAARNGIYGVAMARLLPRRVPARLAAAQLVIDESTAMAVAQPDDRRAREAFFATGISVFVAWNLGTMLGALGGSRLADPESLGLDAAFPAGFIALLLPHLRTRGGRLSALAGAAVAAVGLPLLPNGAPVLVASLGVLLGARAATRATPPPGPGEAGG